MEKNNIETANTVSNKIKFHSAHLCRLISIILVLIFSLGWVLSIIPIDYLNFGAWRMHLSQQLNERSHLPLIAIALYALSLNCNEERKYSPLYYWKRLKFISCLAILIYLCSILNSSITGIILARTEVHAPSIKNQQEIAYKKIDSIESKDELLEMLNSSKIKIGKKNQFNQLSSITDIQLILKEKADQDIQKQTKKITDQAQTKIWKIRMDSLKYTSMSIIYMVFYILMFVFFDRLCKEENAF